MSCSRRIPPRQIPESVRAKAARVVTELRARGADVRGYTISGPYATGLGLPGDPIPLELDCEAPASPLAEELAALARGIDPQIELRWHVAETHRPGATT